MAGIFAILAIAVLAVFNFVLVGDVTTGVLKDLLGGLTGQPVYILAIATASLGAAISAVGGFIGGFFGQLS